MREEPGVLGGEHRLPGHGGHAVERHPPGARAVSGAHFAQRPPFAVGDDDGSRRNGLAQLARQRRPGDRDRDRDQCQRQRRDRDRQHPEAIRQQAYDPASAAKTSEAIRQQAYDLVLGEGEHGLTHQDFGVGRATFGAAGPTVKRVAAVLPRTSGAYMHSARVGGTTKSPGVVARARY